MTTDRRTFLKRTGLVGAGAGVGALALGAAAAPASAVAYVDELKGFVHDSGEERVNVRNPAYGAKGDTRRGTGGAVSSGSTAFTGPAATFAATDVGKVITVQGAGASGAVLSTTIAGYSSPTAVTLATAASTSVGSAAFTFGTDDTAAILAALAAAGRRKEVFLPAGTYTVRASSNGGDPISAATSGGLVGTGGRSVSGPVAGTVLLCADSAAGLVAGGGAVYQGFLVDGNHIASRPLLNSGGAYATFVDVWASGSTGAGWTILGGAHNGYYSCGCTGNAVDGLYIDNGSNDLEFFHFVESDSGRYGIHGDALVGGATSNVRFFDGVCESLVGSTQGVSKIYLRSATDWLFHNMQITGANLTGPTVDLNQANGYGIDLTGCTISATPGAGSPGRACVQVAGTPGSGTAFRFLTTRAVDFTAGDSSVYIAASGAYTYGAYSWTRDATGGPVAASGLPAIDALLGQRTGTWQTATLTAPWTGSVKYRITVDGRVQLQGSASGGTSGSSVLSLPVGYRPPVNKQVTVALASALGTAGINASTGSVTATVLSGTPGTVYFDTVSFPTT